MSDVMKSKVRIVYSTRTEECNGILKKKEYKAHVKIEGHPAGDTIVANGEWSEDKDASANSAIDTVYLQGMQDTLDLVIRMYGDTIYMLKKRVDFNADRTTFVHRWACYVLTVREYAWRKDRGVLAYIGSRDGYSEPTMGELEKMLAEEHNTQERARAAVVQAQPKPSQTGSEVASA